MDEMELRARLEAAEHVIVSATGWLLPEASEFAKKMFLGGLAAMLDSPIHAVDPRTDDAAERAAYILSMRGFLRERIATIERQIADDAKRGRPAAPAEDGR